MKKKGKKSIRLLIIKFFFHKIRRSRLVGIFIESFKIRKFMNYTTRKNKVRYYETDQMGFVHHSNYLKYFEMARIEWFDFLDIKYDQLEKKNIWLPVVECSVKYTNPLFFGDEFEVQIKCEKEPMSTIEFSYQIVNGNKLEICNGTTKLAFYDPETKKPKKCPLEIKEFFFNS